MIATSTANELTPVFIDTSALLGALNARDSCHEEAAALFAALASRRTRLLTTSYVLLETYALVGRRLGVAQARRFRAEFASLLDIVWVDADLHERGLDVWLRAGSRDLSLVDTVSFALLEELGLREALAFDQHFTDRGFVLPQ